MFRQLLSNRSLVNVAAKRQFSATPRTLSPSAFMAHFNKIEPTVKKITPRELYTKTTQDPINGPPQDLHILDIRETYEWNEYHIPFAIYTGRGLLELNIEQIVKDPHDEVVLYCAGGKRSILAAESLTRMGYSNVKSLVNGIGGWRASDYPVYQNINMYSDRIKDY